MNGWANTDRQIGGEFSSWCRNWLDECRRVLKPASPLLIMCGRQMQHHFTIAAEESGFIYKDYIVWDKVSAPFKAQRVECVLSKRKVEYHGNDRLGNLSPLHEPIIYLFKPYRQGTTVTDCFVENKVGCFDADILTTNILRVSSKVPSRQHETQKPIELIEILVKLVTKENHTVLDPFMGSGTTGVACMNTKRKFIGIERDDRYFDISVKRIRGEL